MRSRGRVWQKQNAPRTQVGVIGVQSGLVERCKEIQHWKASPAGRAQFHDRISKCVCAGEGAVPGGEKGVSTAVESRSRAANPAPPEPPVRRRLAGTHARM